MTIKEVEAAISSLLKRDRQAGFYAHEELQKSISTSKKGGKWEDCEEPAGIEYTKREYSPTKSDGSTCKWEWGAKGEYVYCKTSVYKKNAGWTSTIGRKPLRFSAALLVAIKKNEQ